MVCSNGAILGDVSRDKIIEAVTFDAGPVIERLNELVPGAVFAVEDVHGVFYTTHVLHRAVRAENPRGVVRGSHQGARRSIGDAQQPSQEAFGEAASQLGFHQVVYGVADVAWMDVGPHNVGKASMLQEVCSARTFPRTG